MCLIYIAGVCAYMYNGESQRLHLWHVGRPFLHTTSGGPNSDGKAYVSISFDTLSTKKLILQLPKIRSVCLRPSFSPNKVLIISLDKSTIDNNILFHCLSFVLFLAILRFQGFYRGKSAHSFPIAGVKMKNSRAQLQCIDCPAGKFSLGGGRWLAG
jgi:hypothetical protein